MSKKVLIMNTGGTLASVAKEHGLTPGLTTESMMRELHVVAGEALLTTQEFSSRDSANIFPEDWANLAKEISRQRGCFDGIPVVITGSQLSISNPVADAMENLRCAIYMAQSGSPGVFVAFNRKVILGCRASKVRSLSFDAFDSINCENVAEISSIGMKINKRMLQKKKGVFRLQNRYCQDVAVIKMFPGIHREVLQMYAERGYKAFYIEAFGLGGMPFLQHDFISEIRSMTEQGITVLVGTQCRFEGSNLEVYETGRLALDAGAIQTYDMTSEAAVTKLMWVLGQTEDPEEIREYFRLSLCGEVTIP